MRGTIGEGAEDGEGWERTGAPLGGPQGSCPEQSDHLVPSSAPLQEPTQILGKEMVLG